MTSEQITELQTTAVGQAEKLIGKNDATYISQMRNVYLLEIALQLSIANEREAAKASQTTRWRCSECGALIILSSMDGPQTCPNDGALMVRQ